MKLTKNDICFTLKYIKEFIMVNVQILLRASVYNVIIAKIV